MLHRYGNDELHYPPLRFVPAIDMSTENKRKRHSDFKVMMGVIEKKVKEEESLWVLRPTIQQANEMFSAVSTDLGIPERTPKNRLRRISELSWKTALTEVRSKRPRAGNDSLEEEDEDAE